MVNITLCLWFGAAPCCISLSLCHGVKSVRPPVSVLLSIFGHCDKPWNQKYIAYRNATTAIGTHTHPFNGPLSKTTRVSRYQKGRTNLDFTEARDSERQWHQLGHMQVCTLLQTDNHASTPPVKFFTGRMLFLPPNQQRQSTEGSSQQCTLMTHQTKRWLIRADAAVVQFGTTNLLCLATDKHTSKHPILFSFSSMH